MWTEYSVKKWFLIFDVFTSKKGHHDTQDIINILFLDKEVKNQRLKWHFWFKLMVIIKFCQTIIERKLFIFWKLFIRITWNNHVSSMREWRNTVAHEFFMKIIISRFCLIDFMTYTFAWQLPFMQLIRMLVNRVSLFKKKTTTKESSTTGLNVDMGPTQTFTCHTNIYV